jgi:hypothetical protein
MSPAEPLETATNRSRHVGAIRRSLATVQVVTLAESGLEVGEAAPAIVATWADSATVVDRWRALVARVGHWARNARLAGASATFIAWLEASFLFRWLTEEPDPEVIVIDLRKTITVAPFIVLLDRTIQLLAVGTPTSIIGQGSERLAVAVRDEPIRNCSLAVLIIVNTNILVAGALGTLGAVGLSVRLLIVAIALPGLLVRQSWNELQDSRVVRLLIAALEPPEPPEGSTHFEDEQDPGTEN